MEVKYVKTKILKNMLPIFTKPGIYEKTWGRELWIANAPEYCGKIWEFNKGCKCSLHFHVLKQEHFVIEGKFIFTYIDTTSGQEYQKELNTGDVVYIPKGMPHQMMALEDNCRIIEFSTQHFESDSYRIRSGSK